MKILKVLFLISALFQFATAGDLGNPTKIVNGGVMSFGTNVNNNWYTFAMKKAGNILETGKDSTGGSIHYMKIYDENLNYISTSYGRGSSIALGKGNYYIYISESYGGSFKIYSPHMANTKDPYPETGSILKPRKLSNGVEIDFGTNIFTNNYSFGMKKAGNILETGKDSTGGSIHYMKIYDENLNYISTSYGRGSSIALGKGNYYIYISESYGGSFKIYSNNFGLPTPQKPTPTVPDLSGPMADVNGDELEDAISFGTSGISVALSNGADFGYSHLWLNDLGDNQGWDSEDMLRKMADVDGDGMTDVVGFGIKGASVALSNGSSFDDARVWVNDFGYNQGWRKDKSLRVLADVNGDGMADIVAFGNKGISVALSTGSSFGRASLWVNDFGYNQGWRNDKGLRFMSDVNGDGKDDIVGFGNNGVSVALSNGNSFVNAQRWMNDFGYNQGWRNNKGLRYMSDVNGDGKADIVGFGNNGVSVALSNGTSFMNARRWVNDFGYNQGWRNEKDVRLMSDVNGDGKNDIVGFGNNGVSVALSSGNSFTGTSRWLSDFGYNQGWRNYKHYRLTANVDGDGSADIVGFGEDGVKVSVSTGSDFESASLWLNDFGYEQGLEVDFSPYQVQQ